MVVEDWHILGRRMVQTSCRFRFQKKIIIHKCLHNGLLDIVDEVSAVYRDGYPGYEAGLVLVAEIQQGSVQVVDVAETLEGCVVDNCLSAGREDALLEVVVEEVA